MNALVPNRAGYPMDGDALIAFFPVKYFHCRNPESPWIMCKYPSLLPIITMSFSEMAGEPNTEDAVG